MSERFPDMSWEEMEVLEHENGHLLFPATLRTRKSKGEVKEIPVRVRIPSPADHLEARKKTLEWLERLGINGKEEPDIKSSAEDLVILAVSIRTEESPHSQFASGDELAAKYDEGCLKDIKERIQYFKAMLDPREPVQTEEQFWETVEEVARKRNLLPLADIAGDEVPSFMLRTIVELSNCLKKLSGAQSSENSTQEV